MDCLLGSKTTYQIMLQFFSYFNAVLDMEREKVF